MQKKKPLVSVIMGSDSDLPCMEKGFPLLKQFGLSFEVNVLSAHRIPEEVAKIAKGARKKGIKVIIAGAGMAAHLAGVIASFTTLPVIGVPMKGGTVDGLDALLSMVQMPGGVPVATVALGSAGAKNAAILAAQIIGISDKKMEAKLAKHKKNMAETVKKKNKAIKKKY